MKKPKGSTIVSRRSKNGNYNLLAPTSLGKDEPYYFDPASPGDDYLSCQRIKELIDEYEHTNTLVARTPEEVKQYEALKQRYQNNCMVEPPDVAVGDIAAMTCQELAEYIKWYDENSGSIKNAAEYTRYQYAKDKYAMECPYRINIPTGVPVKITDVPINDTFGSGGGGAGGAGGGEAAAKKKSWGWLVLIGLLIAGYFVSGKGKKTTVPDGQ